MARQDSRTDQVRVRDEDIVMSCIANSGEDLDMICQLAKLKGVKAVEINWPGGTGAIIRN